MSEKYYYTKNLNSAVLDEAIRLRTSLRSAFIRCLVRINHDDTVEDNNVELEFSRALTSAEHDEITTIVNLIDDTYDLVVRKGIEENTMAWAMETGKTLLAQFASNNLYRGKTSSQIESLVMNQSVLIQSLLTGSLTTAYGVLLNMSPDANISQDEIDEFKIRLEIVLGL
jgi:hypothetical protein